MRQGALRLGYARSGCAVGRSLSSCWVLGPNLKLEVLIEVIVQYGRKRCTYTYHLGAVGGCRYNQNLFWHSRDVTNDGHHCTCLLRFKCQAKFAKATLEWTAVAMHPTTTRWLTSDLSLLSYRGRLVPP